MKANANKVNFVKHLIQINDNFYKDDKMTPHHVSLYFSLFMSWNNFNFCVPLSINRAEQMKQSKIGSINTYLKCLKELETWGYIKYVPSHNPQKGSKVYLFTFDTTDNTSSDTTTNTTDDTSDVQPMIPLINYNKHLKNFNKTNSKELVNTQNENNEKINFKKEADAKNEDVHKQKLEKSLPKNVEEVEAYFLSKEKSKTQANMFFNYYEANGWMVGKNKMKNWRAAANNWILYDKKNIKSNQEKTTYLHVDQDKDYSIPL